MNNFNFRHWRNYFARRVEEMLSTKSNIPTTLIFPMGIVYSQLLQMFVFKDVADPFSVKNIYDVKNVHLYLCVLDGYYY